MKCESVVDMDDIATFITTFGKITSSDDLRSPSVGVIGQAFSFIDGVGVQFNPDNDVMLRRIYRGYSAADPIGSNVLTVNTGHLGEIDSPMYCNRVWGTAGGQIYKPRITQGGNYQASAARVDDTSGAITIGSVRRKLRSEALRRKKSGTSG